MSVYLHDIPLPDARKKFEDALKSAGLWGVLREETLPLDEQALGRILTEPIWAKISNPHFHASAMDGFAVRSVETSEAMPNRPVTLAYGSQASYLDTGDPLPAWADAVIPIENIEPLDEQDLPSAEVRRPAAIRIRAAVNPWSHVRAMGEDIIATQLVLPSGQVLRAVDLGAIAACGYDGIRVSRPPRVAILPTGTELVPVGKPVKAGEIIEFNSIVLAAQVKRWGGVPVRYEIIPDDFELISRQVMDAAEKHDLVLLIAGSSAGSEDFSARVIERLGELLVHGVAVRPGHPVILGMIKTEMRQVPIIGVPGYPVSAALTGEIFVEPLLSLWQGRPSFKPMTIQAQLTRKVTSPAGDDDYLRVAVGRVGDRILAAPLTRGAGVITSLVRADGLAVLPRGVQGVPAGEQVEVLLYRSPAEIDQTIFIIGSHDMTIDVLAQYLAQADRRVASANVGSLGGLVALRRGEAHLAGIHLLDPESGEYNLSYIRQYLPGTPVQLLGWVDRQQGLLVAKGNPLEIHGLEDLIRPKVTFINRQRGSGTRVLLDYHLSRIGIVGEAIHGFDQEEYTHLAIAAAIASGRADCGLGIVAAARALDLEFIPLFEEQYDLVIPKKFAKSDLLSPFYDMIGQSQFQQAVIALPGYNISRMGKLIAELD